MLTKRELEDASKCHSDYCEPCQMINGEGQSDCVKRSAQTALTLLDMLKRLEWTTQSVYHGPSHHCRICRMTIMQGHLPDCELGNLLREVNPDER